MMLLSFQLLEFRGVNEHLGGHGEKGSKVEVWGMGVSPILKSQCGLLAFTERKELRIITERIF